MAMQNPVKMEDGLDTPKVVWLLVVGSLVLLILIRRGFRGVSVGGVGVSIR